MTNCLKTGHYPCCSSSIFTLQSSCFPAISEITILPLLLAIFPRRKFVCVKEIYRCGSRALKKRPFLKKEYLRK